MKVNLSAKYVRRWKPQLMRMVINSGVIESGQADVPSQSRLDGGDVLMK